MDTEPAPLLALPVRWVCLPGCPPFLLRHTCLELAAADKPFLAPCFPGVAGISYPIRLLIIPNFILHLLTASLHSSHIQVLVDSPR